ncbi:DNA-binding transcriptional regulator, HxlR family [Actinokineospora alba]|uniref:DNA-binding transcriptional regulator, HxlR family n=1 Tax=Actinokineospora alba TaxID=504798 RepID=A0A1H0FQZ0_9PSEU|nr:winged helix-turn-helix transcriptional regulator [Actinokineospora alba]TDP69575.1 HxlR family transcriptional regulator [Actinokineospora alba]SDI13820.1 DNA-binding transcriptional regulator, HxlR family [Actinokineospora alba]SDN96961.1 DNA-binding transcriptional regulator, HxlR family [Actinokineospora alba]
MKGYQQHCPVARAAELLTERWTLLIVRELLHGAQGIDEIAQGLPTAPTATVTTRLRTLVSTGLVTPDHSTARTRFTLTAAGRELESVVDFLGEWSLTRLPPPPITDLDPGLLLYDIARGVDHPTLPARPVAVRVEFAASPPPTQWWLTFSPTGATATDHDPGVPVVATIECTLTALSNVWLGYHTWLGAMTDKTIRLTGDRPTVRTIVNWIGTNRYTPTATVHSERHREPR